MVAGASIAGLLAGRVLTEFFDRVTIVDRDTLPEVPRPRRGVPQAVHAHALLARGREIIEELYGGITAELTEQGGWLADMQRHARLVFEAGPLAPAGSDLVVLTTSRLLLEHAIRERTAALPSVTVLDRCEAVGLVTSQGGRVTGLRVRHGGATKVLEADLVVDATGRSNRGPQWLGELGFEPPAKETVQPGVVYVSREYRRTDADLATVSVAIGSTREIPRGGGMIAAEGGRWVCTLTGMQEHAPPVAPDAFERFAKTLNAPDIHEIVARSEPLTATTRMRISPSTRRRYERLARLPAGFLVVGDALCNFNPTYGQGMTVAALEAIALRDALRAGRAGLARRYFAAAARVIDGPWRMSTNADLRFPWVEGRRTLAARLFNRYLARLSRAATLDAVVAYTFLRAINMIAPPSSLVAPGILVRVLRHRRRQAPVTAPQRFSTAT